jgi:putative transposase
VKDIKQYYTKIQPLKCSIADYKEFSQLNKMSADVWNKCVELNKSHFEKTGKYLNRWELQRELKGFSNLHAKGRHHVIKKYSQNIDDMFKSIKSHHKNSNKVKLPYKIKKYYTTGWDGQSVRIEDSFIYLAKPLLYDEQTKKNKRQKSYKCYVKNIPENIVEVELIYRGNKYYLVIKYKMNEEYLQIQSRIIERLCRSKEQKG